MKRLRWIPWVVGMVWIAAWNDWQAHRARRTTVPERKKYLPWDQAGGPNECAHGYAEGIPCPRCDEAGHRVEKKPKLKEPG